MLYIYHNKSFGLPLPSSTGLYQTLYPNERTCQKRHCSWTSHSYKQTSGHLSSGFTSWSWSGRWKNLRLLWFGVACFEEVWMDWRFKWKKKNVSVFLVRGSLDFTSTHRSSIKAYQSSIYLMSVCFIPKKKTLPLPNPGYQKDRIAKGFTPNWEHHPNGVWPMGHHGCVSSTWDLKCIGFLMA